MNIVSLTLGFVFFFCSVHSQDKKDQFYVQGKLTGRSAGYIFLNYLDKAGKRITDTAKLINGHFSFNGEISEPTFAILEGSKEFRGDQSNVLEFFLEADSISISLVENNFQAADIIGSGTQDEWKKITVTKDKEQRRAIEWSYMANNTYSFLSPHLMLKYLDDYSWDSLKAIYDKWEYPIQESRNGKFIKNEIRKKEWSAVGRLAPDFYVRDLNGEVVQLSSFRGKKLVLLDFWASWCVPCRNGNPSLRKIYKEYASKGLEIIGISYDTDMSSWKKAIKQDSLTNWRHVLVARDFKNISSEDILDKYEGPYIPIKILINRDGIIIGKWIGESEEYMLEITQKLQENLASLTILR